MMANQKEKIKNSEIIFKDIEHAILELKSEEQSPVKIRRFFRTFLVLSQQLTEVMRKEFEDTTGKKWKAKNFSGWDDTTDLFKRLRRTDYHQYPAKIHVQETQYFKVSEIFEDKKDSGQRLVCRGTWDLGDPFSEEIPKGLQLIMADEKTGKITDIAIPPISRTFKFILHPSTDEIKDAIKKAGNSDIQLLSEQCFSKLCKYFEFYESELIKEKKGAPPGG